MLDALLGLEIGPTTARDGGEATPGEEDQDDITAHGGGGGDTGEAFSMSARDDVVADSPPFGGAELGRLCTHLNDRNRRAKRLAQRCQEMFLRLFFKDHSQVVQGLVLSLRSNGFIAYVPAFDAKGPVYISDRDGQVQVDPALLGLPAGAGNPPSKAFATLPACRALPGAGVSLVSTPPAGKSNAVSAYYKAGGGGGPGRDGEGGEDEEVLEVRPPRGGGGKVLRLRVLDGVSLRLSCEVLPTQARLPKVRFLLAGVGNHPASHSPAAAPTGTTATTTSARGTRLEHQRSEVGAGRALFGGFVPRRHAPAASLYDFGGKGQGAGSEQGGGETGRDGGFAGVSSLPSIYNQGGGRGLVPAGGGGVLETLDDARVRQYTQEATTRAQRLGAEKRSSRITKSKRQG
ncbi:conserved unknown protein [Ectocarpus siliculosus]|uniref:Uncharacterized protein n=1 Tax=Ectocarpus siliculosus TaxID=2880 RepID=D8LN42_ECTSI|nr:conserved unknown protein [Ectocarpus siliculosus]|eukprot:CBN74805.1 conserved unknown protein [Ectocarpus siliculosus]